MVILYYKTKCENYNIEIPVNIFKGEELIAQCSSIQETARLFKDEINSKRFNWSAINMGIWSVNLILKMKLLFLQPIKKLLRRKLDTM